MNISKLQKDLRKDIAVSIEASQTGSSVRLEGVVSSWDQKVNAGWLAAKYGFKGVINDIKTEGIADEVLVAPSLSDAKLANKNFDVVIIGGGVIGCAIARELSKYTLSIAVLEKESDVACHTSSRNDGMIHDGFAAKPGTKKALYNAKGNYLWEGLSKEIGIDFYRPGSLIIFGSPLTRAVYPIMAARAKKNNVDGWEFWSKKRVKAEEPNITDEQCGGFYLPSAGILSPYKATAALAENAIVNGVEFFLDTCVTGIEKEGSSISAVMTNRGMCKAGVVINAAGNWADVVAGMAGDRFFSLHQRRGVEMILDIQTGAYLNHIAAMPPLIQAHSKTKGGGLVKTLEGNVLVGPTAREAPGRENYSTSAAEIHELEKHLKLNKKLSMSQIITYFAGVRPCTYEEDFIVETSSSVVNLVHAAGIQSPGLASAPAIAEDIASMAIAIVQKHKPVMAKLHFVSVRKAVPQLRSLEAEERSNLISKNPEYGRIVCRCEEVSEGEIRDALRSPLEINSLDAVKRRTRAGMGRCHGGFCTPRVLEIIADEKKISMDKITKKGPGSGILFCETKTEALEGGSK